ncbi:MAG: hypothetical protein LBR22_02720 [Desulfovibrio sp.]|nr:hypothetical protein [Desulfovibrio sp.]
MYQLALRAGDKELLRIAKRRLDALESACEPYKKDYISISSDPVFKYVFGKKSNRQILLDFLEDMTGLCENSLSDFVYWP